MNKYELPDDIQNGVAFTSFDEAMTKLEEYGKTMAGTNFALLMSYDDGTYKVYPRPSQPCQGGEMRKYGASHGEKSTRPDDRRPGDLRMPFPDGTPEAVAIHIENYAHLGPEHTAEMYNEYIDFVYGADSPYLRGFNNPESVRKLVKEGSERYVGLVFTDTNVDSTVFVNSLQYMRSTGMQNYFQFKGLGFKPKEIHALMMLTGHIQFLTAAGLPVPKGTKPERVTITPTGSYYFPTSASLRRIFEADPFDLTGGTYRDRYDYNRPEVQDLFKAREGDLVFNYKNEFEARFKLKYGEDASETNPKTWMTTHRVTPDAFVEIMNELFDEFYYKNGGIVEVQKEAA